MKFNTIIFIALVTISFCLFTRVVSAQPQLWEIYSNSNQSFINVTVDKYESDSLYIKSTGQIFILHQDSIKYLLKRRESNFGLGFLFGAIAGGVLGAASSSGSDGFFSGIGGGLSIALGALVGGVLGGVVGLASGADEKYKLEKLNTEDERLLLKKLFH
ncbi:MAG: hypothetical protein K9H48_08425 [Melioribacteraceae bacterium]|nr:hypothetical protein [Melioribacteraceae bacterium]MCF8394074.1 hypothetical protein [Melioribacteraceae bacterium]MCF8419840.1 hypothetical protein [Melioribacteraceae bacterium]